MEAVLNLIYSTLIIGFSVWVCSFFYIKVADRNDIRERFFKMDTQKPTNPTTKDAKKARVSKPRPVARPYKKLEGSVLSARVTTMKKQMDIFSSKLVLLKARLGNYEKECELRSEGQ